MEVDRELTILAEARTVHLLVVGGSSSLRPAEGVARFAEGDDIPPGFVAEARQMNDVLDEIERAVDPTAITGTGHLHRVRRR